LAARQMQQGSTIIFKIKYIMILLIRAILVFLIIYLLVRSFVRYFAEEEDSRRFDERGKSQPENGKKGVSREIGEYVDYEEVDD